MLEQFIQFAPGRTCVCIDAANLESAAKDLDWHIDYRKLKSLFSSEKCIGLRHYCVRHGTANQGAFFSFLKRAGFTLVTKPLKRIKADDPLEADLRKANFDVEIAVDAVATMAQFDTLILFSGDSDFAYLIDFLRRRGKHVVVMSTRYHVARELVERSSKYLDLRHLKPWIVRDSKAMNA
ncbi:NYN domain-containing protein [Candidatus Peregrinibacteria bacterium]|nr:NYN domain-containing protein [Candidatus Peregrinibacteria bacterium]MBI3816973.1 NYN domain-containing protein [Candidatus Peregrinibacteria bacterium]